MSSRLKFFKSGVTLTAVGLAMRTVAMLFGAFITRAVGAEGIGLYTVVMTVYSFAVTFATSGISLTVTRAVAGVLGEGRDGEVGRTLRGAIAYSVLFSSLATLVLFFGADFLASTVLGDPRVSSSLRILSLSLVPVSLCSVFSGYFIGVKRVGFNAATQVISQIFKIALTFILISGLTKGSVVTSVVTLCVGITLTEIFTLVIILLQYLIDRKRHSRNSGSGEGKFLKICLEALPLAVSAYVRSILTTIEHILIPKRLLKHGEGREEAYSNYGTLHGMALPLVLYPMSPLTSFSGLLVPEFAEDMGAGRRERMNRVASEAINTTLIYAALCAVFLYCFSEELGFAVYGSYEAGRFVAMLSPIVPIMYLDHVTDGILKGVGEQVYSMWVNITDSLLSVVLVFFLIPAMGISGYAIVIIIMEGYNFLLSVLRLSKRVKIRIEFLSSVLVPLVCAAAACGLCERIFSFDGKGISGAWVTMKIVFAASTFVCLYTIIRIAIRLAKRSQQGKIIQKVKNN